MPCKLVYKDLCLLYKLFHIYEMGSCERKENMYVCMYVYRVGEDVIHIHTYVYVYIDLEVKKEKRGKNAKKKVSILIN